MRHTEKQTRKNSGNNAWKKQVESAEDLKPHAALLVSQGESAEDFKPHDITSLSKENAAFSDDRDSATEITGEEDAFTFFMKAKAKLDRNTKVVESISQLIKPTYDSDEEAPAETIEEGIEWVEGEVDGYKYKVPKDFDEAGKRMNYGELLDDIHKIAEEIVEELQHNRKAMAAMDRFSTRLEDGGDFVPPASFFATPEPIIS